MCVIAGTNTTIQQQQHGGYNHAAATPPMDPLQSVAIVNQLMSSVNGGHGLFSYIFSLLFCNYIHF
jgi:hypothetical protein